MSTLFVNADNATHAANTGHPRYAILWAETDAAGHYWSAADDGLTVGGCYLEWQATLALALEAIERLIPWLWTCSWLRRPGVLLIVDARGYPLYCWHPEHHGLVAFAA